MISRPAALIVGLAIALVACGRQDAAETERVVSGAGDAEREAVKPENPRVSIAGRWRLATVAGQPVRNRDPILLTVDGTIVLKAGCVEREWRYRAEGRKVLTQEASRLTCLRALTEGEELLSATVAGGFAVIDGDAEGQRWRGRSGEVTLVRADAPWVESPPTSGPATLPPSGDIPLPPPTSLLGEWRLAGVDGEPIEGTRGFAIHIGPDRIEFDNCQQIAWRYTYSPPKLATFRTPAVTIDIAPKPLPCATPLPPQLAAMVRAIDAATRVEKTPQNGVLLSGGEGSVLIFRQ